MFLYTMLCTLLIINQLKSFKMEIEILTTKKKLPCENLHGNFI